MTIRILVEISEKDLEKAILPNGGKIKDIEIQETKRRAAANTQKSQAAEEAPKRRGRPKKTTES
jgi:hypothetical protein